MTVTSALPRGSAGRFKGKSVPPTATSHKWGKNKRGLTKARTQPESTRGVNLNAVPGLSGGLVLKCESTLAQRAPTASRTGNARVSFWQCHVACRSAALQCTLTRSGQVTEARSGRKLMV